MIEFIAGVIDPVIRYGLPLSAFVLSLASFFVALRNWRQSNRPIVAVVLQTKKSGNLATLFDLVVLNAGSRPATNVRLSADIGVVRQCLADPNAVDETDALWKDVVRCLSGDTVVPLLLHGKDTSNSFGFTGSFGSRPSFWKYRSRFPLRITYGDLAGNTYVTQQEVVILGSDSFAGGSWRTSAED